MELTEFVLKAISVIPILLILAISPYLIQDVFADHVRMGDDSGNYDDKWWWAEVDNTAGDCESVNYDGGFENRLDSGGNYCWHMKSFKTADLELGWAGAISCQRSSSSPVYFQVRIYDGQLDPSNSTHFPTDSAPITLGAGLLKDYGTNVCPTSDTPDLSASTEDWVTITWETEDDGSGFASIVMDYFSLTGLPEVNSWTFCQENTWDCEDNRPMSPRLGSGESEYGFWYSYNPETVWRSAIAPTDFAVIVTNDTSVNFTWTEINSPGVGVQSQVNSGLNVTGYMLEYKNGTASESDYWTLINQDVGRVETLETGNIFFPGHGYTARTIALGGITGDWLSEPSNEVTFTMSGTETATQTYDEEFLIDSNPGVDNRVYYREQGEYSLISTSGNPNDVGLCGNTQWYSTPSLGYQTGSDNAGIGTCYGHMLVLPTAEVDGVEWIYSGSFHRSVSQVYHNIFIFNGALDVYNSTQFTHAKRSLACEQGENQDECMLYEDALPTATTTFTPDLSASTSDYVTFMVMTYDADANDAWANFKSLSIAGYETFYAPNTTDLQAEFDQTNYITGTEHDWGYFNTLFVATPTLTVELSGDELDAILTWTVGAGAYDATPTGYTIEKECPSGGGWKELVGDTGDTLLTYTDTGAFGAIPGVYEETFDDDVYQPSWQSTDDQAPHFITYHSGDDEMKFAPELDNTDVHIIFPLPSGAVSNTEFIMEYKMTLTDMTGSSGANYWWFGLTDFNSGSVHTVNQDFLGIAFFGWSSSSTSVYIVHKNGASTTSTDTGYDMPRTEGADYFFKVTRESATNLNLKIYSTPYEDSDNLLFEKDQTVSSAIIGLENIVSSNLISSSGTEWKFQGQIDNLKIQDGLVAMQSESTSCNYRVKTISSIGSSGVSNEASVSQESGVSLTSPDTFTCTPSGTGSVELTWNYAGAEVAEGFRIDSESPTGNGFSTILADTGSADTTRTITGLSADTLYNMKVAVLVSPDTSGFSNANTCKTSASSGGGGSPSPGSPSEPVVTPGVDGDSDTDSGAFETIVGGDDTPLFDLTFPLIQELTNSFSGDIFTLVGAKHSAGLGQTVTGEMLVGWNNQENILISSVIVAPTQLSVNPNPLPPYIAEGGLLLNDNQIKNLSIIPPVSENIKSHQLIPYSITIPSLFCGAGITEDCVTPGTHKIPVKVVSTQGGQNIANTARIEVAVGVPTIQFDIPTFVMIALIAVGILGAYFVNKKIKASKKQGVKHV